MQGQFSVELNRERKDPVEVSLRSISQNIITVTFGVLPLFFIPVVFAPFGYTKTLLVIFGASISIIFFSLSVLRSGSVGIKSPFALIAFWVVAVGSALSALLSGDMYDSFIGDTVGVHTVLFTALLGIVMSIPVVVGQSKTTIMRLYILLTGSAILLGVFHVLRIIFGADFFSLEIFTTLTQSPLGGWNDVGLFFGLTILLSLVALEQLPLTKWGKVLFSVVVGISLCMLAVVNFFAIWIVLALVSLVQLMYTLTKDRFIQDALPLQEKDSPSVYSVSLAVFIFIFSLIFIVGGSAVGGFVAKVTHISYVEVRPSLEATVDVARHVYKENAFVGIGPNKFIDAWRLYKDPSINQTVFWSTDFTNGSGFITTQFVTNGILSVLSWIVFFILFLLAGFRMLFKSVHVDRFWYFIGTSSFVASLYLWSMALFYNPGPVILLLTAMFTGVMFVSHGALLSHTGRQFSITSNRRTGFILVAIVMVIIIIFSSSLYYIGRHYASVYTFGDALGGVHGSLEEVEQKIASAYTVVPSDVYARQLAVYQLAKINTLLGVSEPTSEQQQVFQTTAANGINAARLAVDTDPTDASNWAVLGEMYSILASAGVEGAQDRAVEAFDEALTYDPANPSYMLAKAKVYARTNNLTSARASVMSAMQLKPNYTEALFFLAQIDISEGNAEDAIEATRAIISLEPNNPARYYQLGILELAADNIDNAIISLTQAISLDTNYANAQYYLALALIQKGEIPKALEHLEVVSELNPDNADILNLITKLKTGDTFDLKQEVFSEQISEPEVVSDEGADVTVTQSPDETPLIGTVNLNTNASEELDNTQTSAQ